MKRVDEMLIAKREILLNHNALFKKNNMPKNLLKSICIGDNMLRS